MELYPQHGQNVEDPITEYEHPHFEQTSFCSIMARALIGNKGCFSHPETFSDIETNPVLG